MTPPRTIDDLSAFRLASPVARKKGKNGKSPNKYIKGKPFLRGPIPLDWLITACRLQGRALHVALAIWYRVGKANSTTITLTTKLLEEFGIDRFTKTRALRQLERAGLVTVAQEKGKNPVVTILEEIDLSQGNNEEKPNDFGK